MIKQKTKRTRKPKSKMRNISLKAMLSTLLFSLIIVTATQTYAVSFDETTTPTLWNIKDKGERFAATKARYGNGHYIDRMAEFLKEKTTTGGVVFLGDSITDYSHMDDIFGAGLHGKPVFNRGVGGDTVLGLIERLDVSVIALEPSEIYVMIGVNDIFSNTYKNGNLLDVYRLLYKSLKQIAPKAKITALSIIPVNKGMNITGTVPQDILAANEHLKTVCAEEAIEYFDLYSLFVNKNGEMKKGFTLDGCHPCTLGNLKWFEALAKTPEERFKMWQCIAGKPYWPERNIIGIDGVNVPRDNNMVVVYRRDANSTQTRTQTKDGREAVVQNGKVTFVGGNNLPIPEGDGYVLSVLDSWRTYWFMCNVMEGAELSISDDTKTLTLVSNTSDEDDDSSMSLRRTILTELAKKPNPEKLEKLKRITMKMDSLYKGDLSRANEIKQELTTVIEEKNQ